jgi:hypothetical protein
MISKITYTSIINHADLGATTIPIENFSARLREGDADSYLQVTIGDYATYQETLIAYMEECRTSSMTLYKNLYTTPTAYTQYAICTVDVETLSLENGSRSDSIILTGHRATWNPAPATRTLTGVNYEKRGLDDTYDTTYRVRCSPDNILYPSDTITYTTARSTYTFTAVLVSVSADSIEVTSDG